MSQVGEGDELVVNALRFLKKTKDGEYCEINFLKYKERRIDAQDIAMDEEIFIYSVSN